MPSIGDKVRIEGSEVYELAFTSTEFTVLCAKGTNKFSGQRMMGVLQELARYLSYTAIVSGMHMPDDHGVAAQLREDYLGPPNN
ncbi:hypothetical protein A4A58_15770 [Tardiphaga robiniae]|uniref:Uncharacterized protein n=1 Tax=Tardiphaga robiniae TaxID=943830 RepID=A0A163XQP5_9BRAD|nr:hypothetical protein A4A58_15770 [Tardiphaga robiniae]